MALSVHELRDIAPGHARSAHGGDLSGIENWATVRKFGGPALRFTFTMVATLSLALVGWSLVTSALQNPQSRSPNGGTASLYRQKDGDALRAGQTPEFVARINAWIASIASGLFSSGKSGSRDSFQGERGLSGGLDLSIRTGKADPRVAPITVNNFDLAGLKKFSTVAPISAPTADLPRGSQIVAPPAHTGITAVDAGAPAQRPKSPETPGFVTPQTKPAPQTFSPSPAPADTPVRAQPQAQTQIQMRNPSSPPAQPQQMATLRPAGQPAPANPVAANPPQTNASETGVNNAIRAAQSDFRLYEDASKALQTLVANQPAARARADFEQQVRSLAELRRAALAERGTVDPAKDKFGAAHITDEGAAYIAQCLRDIDGLASVAIGSKGVDIQPAIPAWIVTAVAPDLPKGKSSAKDQLTEQLHNCIAPLHQAGTAAVLVDADANHPLVRRISQTSGAIMWTPAR